MSSSTKSTNQPIAGDGFVDLPPATARDPYEVLAELMEVVEELCPQWPPRETFESHHIFLM
jgi:hypothetical protein